MKTHESILCLLILGFVCGDSQLMKVEFGENDFENPSKINGTITKLVLQLAKFEDESYTAIIPSNLNDYIGIAIQTNCMSKEVGCGAVNIGLFDFEDARKRGIYLKADSEMKVTFDKGEKLFLVFKIYDENNPLILRYRKKKKDANYEGNVTFNLITLSTENKTDQSIQLKITPQSEAKPKTFYTSCSKNVADLFTSVDVKNFTRCDDPVPKEKPTTGRSSDSPSNGGLNKTDSSNKAMIRGIVVAVVLLILIGVIVLFIFRKKIFRRKDRESSSIRQNYEDVLVSIRDQDDNAENEQETAEHNKKLIEKGDVLNKSVSVNDLEKSNEQPQIDKNDTKTAESNKTEIVCDQFDATKLNKTDDSPKKENKEEPPSSATAGQVVEVLPLTDAIENGNPNPEIC